MLAQRFLASHSSRGRLLVRVVAGVLAALTFGVLSMTGAAAPGGGGANAPQFALL